MSFGSVQCSASSSPSPSLYSAAGVVDVGAALVDTGATVCACDVGAKIDILAMVRVTASVTMAMSLSNFLVQIRPLTPIMGNQSCRFCILKLPPREERRGNDQSGRDVA